MPFTVKDRVRETSVTTGVGEYTLAGAPVGFQAFSAIGANNTCPYFATDNVNWEVGIGTVLAGPARLQRTAILASSNGGAAVNWGVGTREIICGMPATLGFPRVVTKSVAGAVDVNLTADEMRADILILTGAITANINVVVDAAAWRWTVYNNTSGAFTLTFKTTAGTGKLVTQGRRVHLICDGVNIVPGADDVVVADGSTEMTGDLTIANNKGIKIKNSTANALYALLRTAADVLQLGGAAGNNTEIVIGSSVKATFDNAGKMGLGRVADTELLEVSGSARVISGTCDGRLRPNGGSSQVEVGAFSNHDLAFIANNIVQARITAAGIFSANAIESKTTNGYVKLPSGIYIQWGSANVNTTGVGITFPVAFPTACVAVVNTCNNQTNPPAAMASAVSTTGFTATTSAGTPSIFWIAIGY